MIKIKDQKTLDILTPGSLVFYQFFYDGWNNFLAEKFQDGKWYVGDNIDGFDEVEPSTPCYLIFWEGRVVGG